MIEPPPPTTREFRCIHCNGTIAIPYDLPPTTAPCPHCNNPITSPAVGVAPVSQIPEPAATGPTTLETFEEWA